MKFTLTLKGPLAEMVQEVADVEGLSLQNATRHILEEYLERAILQGWVVPNAPKSTLGDRDVPGFVYLLQHGREPHLFKVGFSSNPERRRNQIEVTESCPVTILATIPAADMRRLERDLHREHARKRIRGEWFLLSEKDVEAICRLAEKES